MHQKRQAADQCRFRFAVGEDNKRLTNLID